MKCKVRISGAASRVNRWQVRRDLSVQMNDEPLAESVPIRKRQDLARMGAQLSVLDRIVATVCIMRLLEVESVIGSERPILKEFVGSVVPEYVILSHTWGGEEVSLNDIQNGAAKDSKGFNKIEGCCRQAHKDGFSYAWIDTCCIDKRSSAELQEAINSMFQWYADSQICYVYLQDVNEDHHIEDQMKSCRWVTRGWTLQELIAPQVVEFYSETWVEIGTKRSLHKELSIITGISKHILFGGNPHQRSVAERMSWAARRKTTRVEDEAYCLMGLFGVNMPMLYGEGKNAFQRLQEEILKITNDPTLLAWTSPNEDSYEWEGVLADSPAKFEFAQAFYGALTPYDYSLKQYQPPVLANKGLRITLPLISREDLAQREEPSTMHYLGKFSYVAILASYQTVPAAPGARDKSLLGITLAPHPSDESPHVRVNQSKAISFPETHAALIKPRTIYLASFGRSDIPMGIPGLNLLWCRIIYHLHPLIEIQKCKATVNTHDEFGASSSVHCASNRALACFEIRIKTPEGAISIIGRNSSNKLVAVFGRQIKTPWCAFAKVPVSAELKASSLYNLIEKNPSLEATSFDADRAQYATNGVVLHLSIKRRPVTVRNNKVSRLTTLAVFVHLEGTWGEDETETS